MKKLYFAFALLFSVVSYAQDPCSGITSVDYAGQTYHTVAIGNQCWFKENLNVGTIIPAVQEQTNNQVIEKSCYDDNPSSCTTYGGLYQWDEALQYKKSSGTVKGICPTGWHIPSEKEFIELRTAVNNDGNSLKALGEGIGEGEGTNKSGFSALMAIGNYNGMWYSQHTSCFWSSTEYNYSDGVDMYLGLHYSPVYIGNESKTYGFSVRCIKDNSSTGLNGEKSGQMPGEFSLMQNYPNPFNPATVISYQLPVNSQVRLKVYDSIGNEIAILVNEFKPAGSYQVSFDGSKLSSGIYYYELTAGSYKKTSKMILAK
ncbi:MAG: FISUMP domain-containing protein [Bacillota bacterium]